MCLFQKRKPIVPSPTYVKAYLDSFSQGKYEDLQIEPKVCQRGIDWEGGGGGGGGGGWLFLAPFT